MDLDIGFQGLALIQGQIYNPGRFPWKMTRTYRDSVTFRGGEVTSQTASRSSTEVTSQTASQWSTTSQPEGAQKSGEKRNHYLPVN